MKDILLQLANGNNHFEVTIFGQKAIGEIIQLDLWGFNEGKGRALFRLKDPVKKTIRKEVESSSFGMDSDYTHYENVEVDVYEEWLSIGY